MDLIPISLAGSDNERNIFLAIDVFSKWPIIEVMKNKLSATTANIFK